MKDGYAITTSEGTIEIGDDVVDQLVRRAAEETEGVRVRRRGVDIAFDDDRAHGSLEIGANYGSVLPAVAREVQERVADALAGMCGVQVDAVDVAIEELH